MHYFLIISLSKRIKFERKKLNISRCNSIKYLEPRVGSLKISSIKQKVLRLVLVIGQIQ